MVEGMRFIFLASACSLCFADFELNIRRGLAALLRSSTLKRTAKGGLGAFEVSPGTATVAVESFKTALKFQPTSVVAAVSLAITARVFVGDTKISSFLLEEAVEVYPTDYLSLLAQGLFTGNRELLNKAAHFHPSRPESWLAIALDPQRNRSMAEAAMRRALRLKPPSRMVHSWAIAKLRTQSREWESWRLSEKAVAAGLWHHPLQRTRNFFWRGLASAPLPGADIEARWPEFRAARLYMQESVLSGGLVDEFRAVRASHPPQDDPHSPVGYWVQSCHVGPRCTIKGVNVVDDVSRAEGSWAEYTIWDPMKHENSVCSVVFPKACGVMKQLMLNDIPATRLAITEVHPPRTHIPRHLSPQQGRLRLLCPLDVSGDSMSRLFFPGAGEFRYTADHVGICVWFDESFEHELFYEGDAARASLILDVPHPALKEADALGLELEIDAPDVPEHWNFLYGPMVALAKEWNVSTGHVDF